MKNFKNFNQLVILRPAEVRAILEHREKTGLPFMVVRDFSNGKQLRYLSVNDDATQELYNAVKARTLKIVLISDQVEYLKNAGELLLKHGDVDMVLIQFGEDNICLLPEKLWTYKITECKQCIRYLMRKGVSKQARKMHMDQHLIDYYHIGKVAGEPDT